MVKPIVGYWDLRGLGEPIRYLLRYKNVDFEDKRYAFGKDEWKNEKFTLGFPFPNLPYYIEGDIKLTQSNAILRYLARKHGMDGEDEQQKCKVFLAEQQITDLHYNLVYLVENPNYEKIKGEFFKTIPTLLKLWEEFLGDQKYLTGDSITYVDFMAYDVFDFYRIIHAESLDEFPGLQAFQERIKNIPEIQKHMNSATYKKWPIFAPNAVYAGSGEPPAHL
ncbi:glutathione S-transferase Mu 1 [Caerostris extrusa]|uniref:glutathione transferase n=1 Tax=Caerostris extrusa TaxID=172846 RepID=A0AAV4S684_CAEEX|nr:glutathione S-transferase Mu 1 [Caerostris extrusa]